MGRFAEVAFTPAVKALQVENGSRRAYARLAAQEAPDELGDAERDFIGERDSFYLGSVGENGWPYVQHRGGTKGFVHVLDEHTLAFADYRGNKQYISAGNVKGDDRVALIFVDYPNQARLKILAHAKLVSAKEAPELLAKLTERGERTPVERAWVLAVEALDWNCPQHITPRFTEEEIAAGVRPLQEKLAALEKENAELRARVKSAGL